MEDIERDLAHEHDMEMLRREQLRADIDDDEDPAWLDQQAIDDAWDSEYAIDEWED